MRKMYRQEIAEDRKERSLFYYIEVKACRGRPAAPHSLPAHLQNNLIVDSMGLLLLGDTIL